MTPRKKLAPAPSAVSGRAVDFNVESTVHGMDSNYLQCRDFGHSWRPYTASWLPEQRCYETQLRCQRCKTLRVRFIGQRGELLRSNYDYTDGYIIKGMGRLTGTERDLVRLESVQRILPEDTAEEA